ncbi:MAG: Uma2 family endonuclease [Actinomycetota bacterium]
MAVQPQPYRFTVEEYYRMAEAGILGEDDRVELIEGEIIAMAPIGSPHAGCVTRLTELFIRGVEGRATVIIQNPVRLDGHTEPQPDLMLARRRDDFYRERHPGPDDVLLLVEVADTSGRYDRGVKLPLYASAGIPEIWVIDLIQHRLEAYRSPSPDGYGEVLELGAGDRVAPIAFEDLLIEVGELAG